MCFLERGKQAKKGKMSEGVPREKERKQPKLKFNGDAEKFVCEKRVILGNRTSKKELIAVEPQLRWLF